MTVYEAITAHAALLKSLARCGVTVEDVRHIDLYCAFNTMRDAGEKTTYIVACLRDRFAVSERTVWRVVRKFRRTILSC